MPEIVVPGALWHLPLEDPKTRANKVLLVWVDPSDTAAGFYESLPVDEFPDSEDRSAFIALCAAAAYSRSLANRRNRPTKKYADKQMGRFRLLLRHSATMGLSNS